MATVAGKLIIILLCTLVLVQVVRAAPVEPERLVYRDYDSLLRKNTIRIQNYNNEQLEITLRVPEQLLPYLRIEQMQTTLPAHFLETQIPFNFEFPSEKRLEMMNETSFEVTLRSSSGRMESYTIPIVFKDSIDFPEPAIKQFFNRILSLFTGRSVQENTVEEYGPNNKMLLRSIIITLLLVTGGLGTYMNYRYLKNKYMKRPLHHVNLSLLSFIISQLTKDVPKTEIVQTLIKHNWDRERIEQHFDIAISYHYNLKLLKYITRSRQKNMSKDQIRENLLHHNWDQDAVEKHLNLLQEH